MLNRDTFWLAKARTYIGLKEIVGPKHNSVILTWLAKLGAWWSDDETAWCGTFVAAVMKESGQPIPKLWFRAKEWLTYGSALSLDRLAPGAILIFGREGGGHVGFYVGESRNYFYVLGGNQSNGVNITRISKLRCIGARWPKGQPVIFGRVAMTDAGAPVSKNEA